MEKTDTKKHRASAEEIHVLLCVAKGRQSLSRGVINEILRGSHSVRVFSRRLYQNSAFGTCKGWPEEDVDTLIQRLIDQRLLEETTDEFPRLTLTEDGKVILHENADEYKREIRY